MVINHTLIMSWNGGTKEKRLSLDATFSWQGQLQLILKDSPDLPWSIAIAPKILKKFFLPQCIHGLPEPIMFIGNQFTVISQVTRDSLSQTVLSSEIRSITLGESTKKPFIQRISPLGFS